MLVVLATFKEGPFYSCHSKIVKGDIVLSCLRSSPSKSCCHMVQANFFSQAKHLCNAGFLQALLQALAELFSKAMCHIGFPGTENMGRPMLEVMPYIHRIPHGIKRVAVEFGMDTLFAAPCKSSCICECKLLFDQMKGKGSKGT